MILYKCFSVELPKIRSLLPASYRQGYIGSERVWCSNSDSKYIAKRVLKQAILFCILLHNPLRMVAAAGLGASQYPTIYTARAQTWLPHPGPQGVGWVQKISLKESGLAGA